MTPGEYLRSIREAANRPLRDIASQYCVSVPYLSDLERGKRDIPRDRADRRLLCKAYGADLDALDLALAEIGTPVHIADLSAANREKVARFVAGLRAGRAA